MRVKQKIDKRGGKVIAHRPIVVKNEKGAIGFWESGK